MRAPKKPLPLIMLAVSSLAAESFLFLFFFFGNDVHSLVDKNVVARRLQVGDLEGVKKRRFGWLRERQDNKCINFYFIKGCLCWDVLQLFVQTYHRLLQHFDTSITNQ